MVYQEQRAERKEQILGIRAKLRQNSTLREDIIKKVFEMLNIDTHSDDSQLFLKNHFTLALDEELNDNSVHVIV